MFKMGKKRRGVRGFDITSLPYEIKVYLNNQVLLPAQLVRNLGFQNAEYAKITLEYKGNTIILDRVKLLRTRHTDSRQFTIPKNVREKFNIKPGDTIKVVSIEPLE